MSSGVATTNSPTAATPGGATVTHHRRRVADSTNADQEKPADGSQLPADATDHSKSDADEEAVFSNGSGHGGGGGGYHHHHQRPAIRFLLSRKRVPESWALCVEECVLSACGFFNSLTSRKNMGRTVLVFLLAMMVVSAFVKFSLGGAGSGKIVRWDTEVLFIQNFKNDLSYIYSISHDPRRRLPPRLHGRHPLRPPALLLPGEHPFPFRLLHLLRRPPPHHLRLLSLPPVPNLPLRRRIRRRPYLHLHPRRPRLPPQLRPQLPRRSSPPLHLQGRSRE